MVTEEDLQYEQELLENLSVEDIRQMYPDEVLFWVRGSGASAAHPEGAYYGVLDYRGNVRFMEGSVKGATAYGAILEGVKAAAERLRTPVRFHVIAPTDLYFRRTGFEGRAGQNGPLMQEIFETLYRKGCRMSYSRADSDTVKEWINSHADRPMEPKENRYRKIVYRECLGKVTEILRNYRVSDEIIRRISELEPD